MTVQTQEETRKEMTTTAKQELSGAESTRPGRSFTPAVDIFESDAAITLLADMPGVRPDGLTVDLRDNVLTVSGDARPLEGRDEHVLVREYETGSFYRQFRLSSKIDQSKIEAVLRDGVLHLTLTKAEPARPRRIAVRTD